MLSFAFKTTPNSRPNCSTKFFRWFISLTIFALQSVMAEMRLWYKFFAVLANRVILSNFRLQLCLFFCSHFLPFFRLSTFKFSCFCTYSFFSRFIFFVFLSSKIVIAVLASICSIEKLSHGFNTVTENTRSRLFRIYNTVLVFFSTVFIPTYLTDSIIRRTE